MLLTHAPISAIDSRTEHRPKLLQPRDPLGKQFGHTWTTEQISDLDQWWTSARASAGVCAKLLNDKYQTKFTRSAVMGRVFRDGLPKHVRQPARRMPRQGWVGVRPRRAKEAKAPKPAYVEVALIEDFAIPFEQRKTLQQLERGICKWPVGDPQTPEFFFCGGKALETYCPGHCKRAYGYVREAPRY